MGTKTIPAVVLLTVALTSALETRAADPVDWPVCLQTRTGKYLDISNRDSKIFARLDKCEGAAVFTIRDLNGGALTGTDKVRIGTKDLARRWSTNTNTGEMVQYIRDKTIGGNEYFNIHRIDREAKPIATGDKVAINGYTGWAYDQGGNGPLYASAGIIGAGETFTIRFGWENAADADGALKTADAVKARKIAAMAAIDLAGTTVNFGDRVILKSGGKYMGADFAGRVTLTTDTNKASVFEVHDPAGGDQGRRAVNLLKDQVALRIAGSHRWLSASNTADDGLIYQFQRLIEVYNFNKDRDGQNGGTNNVLIMGPKSVPTGWVYLGDAVFRYRELAARELDNIKTIIFKDHPAAFSKISRWEKVWTRENDSRDYVGRAKKSGAYNAFIGGMFFGPGGSKQRMMHGKYANRGAPKHSAKFLKLAAPQWTSRGQRYHHGGVFLVYNAAALTRIADNVALPLLWVAKWGNPIDYDKGWDSKSDVPYGLPDFLNEQFMKDFSYFAQPNQLRARPGAEGGKRPANRAFSALAFYNSDIKNWADESPVANGARVKIRHVNSGICRSDVCSLHPSGANIQTKTRYTDAAAWTILKATGARVGLSREERLVRKPPPPRLGGSGGAPQSTGKSGIRLASGWRPYKKDYLDPAARKNGELVSLQGLAIGGKRGSQMASLPAGQRPNGTLIFNGNNHDHQARLDVHPDGGVVWSTGARADGTYISLSNIHFSARGGRNLALTGGWGNYGGGYAPARVDKIGNTVTLSGLIRGGRYGHMATLPSGHRPPQRLIFSVNNHGKQARVDVLPNGRVIWVAGGRDHGWISLSGITFSVRPDRSLPLVGSWRAYGGEYRLPEVTKAGNLVILSGLLKGTKARPAHLATLPSGYRPSRRLVFNVNGHDKTSRVDIFPNGVVRVETGGTKHGWVSLSGIVFSMR